MKHIIKKWGFSLLTFIFIALFLVLGQWQLNRAQEKKLILNNYHARSTQPPLSSKQLNGASDLHFYQIKIVGQFDNAHTFLLDNKTQHGQIGYEIYTPFILKDKPLTLLVDRGFIPMMNRDQLPIIKLIKGKITLQGMLMTPPHLFTLGQISDEPSITWPMRIEFIDLSLISKWLGQPLFPYVVLAHSQGSAAFISEKQITSMPPEKHLGYALQWFALALTLLLLFIAQNHKKN